MICKKTLHGRFVSGRFTPIRMLAFSLILMLMAFWFPASAVPVELPEDFSFLGVVTSRLVSILLYAASALLISDQIFFDKRVQWVGALYFCMVAILPFANGNGILALTSLLLVRSLVALFACNQYGANYIKLLYTVFMILGFMTFVTPFVLYLIPLYLVYCLFVNVFSVRLFLASLLGLLTPFWIILGTEYVFGGSGVLADSVLTGINAAFSLSVGGNSHLSIILLVFALMLMLPAVATFVRSAYPTKPHLRRRLSFIMVADAYLLLLYCFVGNGAMLFYFWQLPFLTVLATYLFSGKQTKRINLYFIVVNIVMLAIATQSLWLKR